ncbi:MAG: glycoside hydrolase family 3 protein [Clostridia bacterium]|nr:glycoside hydrolase family 3 protein [Clostridia bacterium]
MLKRIFAFILAAALAAALYPIAAAEDAAYAVVEESGAQQRLTYTEGVTALLEADGLLFKDMNGNGALDAYEDWRLPAQERAENLLAQMDAYEKAGTLFCVSPVPALAGEAIAEFHITSLIFNLNETPDGTARALNGVQALAEAERLSIPVTVFTDREYAFAGLLDAAHAALGSADDNDLTSALCAFYGEAMEKMGYHVTLNPQGVEIGAAYGENPEHIASTVTSEISGLMAGGLSACAKYWIGRGGDSAYGDAGSVAANLDNWMVGWRAAIGAGVEYIMTDCGGTGLSATTDVKWDKATMSYLRDTLGYGGIVISDRQALGRGAHVTGVTAEGVDLAEQSGAWLYNEALKNGTDMFSSGTVYHGTDVNGADQGNGTRVGSPMSAWPDCIAEGLLSGEVEEEYVDRSVLRVLVYKFEKGLFEDPYRDPDEALRFAASEAFCQEKWEIEDNATLRAARNPLEVELTERLQAQSAVLLKNAEGLLPLAAGTKVYFTGASADVIDLYKECIGEYGEIVSSVEEADVCVGLFSTLGEAAEILLEDAWYEEKPVVLTLTAKATEYALQNADAVLYLPYVQQPAYGEGGIGFVFGTEPWVYAGLLFGAREPGGILQKEQARTEAENALQWDDLAGDQGANDYVRLLVQALMEDDPNHASPANYGDPLLPYRYGMAYGERGDFVFSCLMMPRVTREIETMNSRGEAVVIPTTDNQAVAGEPITVRCLLRNNGGDDIVPVVVYANDRPVAEKLYAVEGGSWRVVQIEIILESGDYTIRIGGATGELSVQ